jgi:SAM-dependent methyltransferase
VPCDLCNSTEQNLLYSKIDFVTGNDFHLVECGCGMAFVNPMPTEDSIGSLYPTDYLEGKDTMDSLYKRMARRLPKGIPGKLLDIGCGRGDFISYTRKLGWDVTGIDLLDHAGKADVPIITGNFITMDFAESYYDVVTAWAVLEHVRTPSLFFQKIGRILKPGGSFIFTAPNFSAYGMRHACVEDIPRHLWLFTPRAVCSYLKNSGMKPAVISHCGRIYTSYPFGLLRYLLVRMFHKTTDCTMYENRSVSLLRHRDVKNNLGAWVVEVLEELKYWEIAIDAMDLVLGILVANLSKMMRNYGVMTVVATK